MIEPRFVQREKVRIAYQQRGHGPPIMLVSGLGMPGRLWLNLPGGLVKKGYTVLVPDNRGTGSSDVPRPPYRLRDMVDDLAAVLDAVDGGPAMVVGISLGGMLAQHLAIRHPEKVTGLVLAATTCGPPVGRLIRIGFLAVLARSMFGDRMAMEQMRRLLVHQRTLQANPRIFEQWDREAQAEPTSWRGMLGQLAAAATHSTGFILDRITCPVEIVAGEDDRIVPAENSRILARRIPGARLTMLPEAGHAFPLDAPEALPAAVERLQARLLEGSRAQRSSTR